VTERPEGVDDDVDFDARGLERHEAPGFLVGAHGVLEERIEVLADLGVFSQFVAGRAVAVELPAAMPELAAVVGRVQPRASRDERIIRVEE
jgi:hypothetical protein